jgi:hypothetical protein
MLGNKYACVPSEETITDRHLLQIAAEELPCLKILKASKNVEGRCGFDWEWWVGSQASGWIRYTIQAKKINLTTHRYNGIKQKLKGRFQIDILTEFSQTHGSIALYCLYNGNLDWFGPACWHCYEDYDEKQLGCVLTPSVAVDDCLRREDTKALCTLMQRNSVPWRCLFKCNKDHSRFSFRGISHCWADEIPSFRVYRSLPDGVGRILPSSDLYRSSSGAYPKRILVLDASKLLGNE